MFKWKLERPLAVFDIEATGISPRADRIVELAIVKLMPDQSRETLSLRINPGIPIPQEVIDIHGITDDDVVDCPSFTELAPRISEILKDCDLGGYNVLRFDIPMLIEEFARAGHAFQVETRRVIDAQRIYHRREPRDLSAALAFFCGEMHLNAHGAEADVDATIRVLEGQFARYKDLPQDIDELDDYCNPRNPAWVDKTGKLKWHNKQVVLNFGRKKGESLQDLVKNDPGFINWMLRSDFPRDTREIIEDMIAGKLPSP